MKAGTIFNLKLNELHWWKPLGVLLISLAIIGGLLIPVPRLAILHETIRNLFYHVPMWFGMMILFTVSVVTGIMYLNKGNSNLDIISYRCTSVGLFLGLLGLLTGSLWAKFTWGAWWVADPKLNGTAVAMLTYLAYLVLRGSLDDEQKRARLSAVYNIFAYVMMIVLIMILPRITDSLHPGNGGNPAFGKYDMDNTMRLIFYPAVIGWTLLGAWLVNLQVRLDRLQLKWKTK